jgi:Domain of unknown function (DUF4388)
MLDREDLLRVDATGMIHPVGKTASQALRARAGEWRMVEGPTDVLLMRRASNGSAPAPVLKLAGEIRSPGAMCDIVALIAQAQWRGELAIIDEQAHRSFFFDEASVVGVATNVAEERLGETLYRAGVLTREQLDTALSFAKSSGRRFGEVILELEFQRPEQLFPMMARQVEEVFYTVLQLSAGTFYFFDRFDDKLITHRSNLNIAGLLMEGVRRMDEMRFFREKVPNDDYIPIPTNTGGKKPPDELAAVFAECDGKRRIAEIERSTGLPEFEVTRGVFQLLSGGFVTVSSPRPQGAESIVSVFNRALAAVHAACAQAGKVADLKEGLSRFATGAGIYDPLFLGAGPLDDGTLRPDRVARNLAALAGDDPDAWLTQLMHEYAGFAMFQAESLLSRDTERTLKDAVGEMLKPVRPVESGSNTGSLSGLFSESTASIFGPSSRR